MDAVLSRLAEDSIGAGSLSREFSQGVARYVGRRSGISFRSYGHALGAIARALDLPRGSRIGVSALVHVAVKHVFEEYGYVVVPIDTDRSLPVLPSPLNYDYEALGLAALYADTRLGYVPDLEHMRQLGIPLLEDVSEGFGGNTGSSKVGSVGDLTVIGLEPEHIITAGGGAVVISSSTKRVSVLSSCVDPAVGEPPLPDMNAALGITQLKQIERFIERRKEIAARFVGVVQRGRYRVPLQGGDGDNVFFALPVMVDSSPREVEKYAQGHGVAVQRAFVDTVLSVLTGDGGDGGRGDDERDEDGRGDVERGEEGVRGDSEGEQGQDGAWGERGEWRERGEEGVRGGSVAARFPNALTFSSQTVLFPLYPTLGKSEQERVERVLATLP